MTNTTQYGLLDTASNELVSMEKESNVGQCFCGDYTHKLVIDPYEPKFLKDNPTDFDAILAEGYYSPWYNSDEDEPMLGDLDNTKLKVVKITTTYEQLKGN